MNRKERKIIFIAFLMIYVFLGAYNYLNRSQWLLDNMLSLAFLTLIYFMNRWLKLGMYSFMLFNLALISHNLGTFGLYEWTLGVLGYDNIVHFISSLAAAFIIFNFIARKLHIRRSKSVRKTVIDEHLSLMIFLVIASVAMMGTLIELMEFGGYTYLGEGEGIFFVGAGDSGNEASGQYVDTMTDIIVNTLGSILGVLVYYFFRYKKQPWLKYG